jgi:hypothetical protein
MNAKISPTTQFLGRPIGQIAQSDALLARALIQPQLIGQCDPRCNANGWQILNLSGCFNSGAIQTVDAEICGITQDLWICDLEYTVRRPNAFAGNILKAQSDYYNARNPNIDFTLQVKSFCNYLISPDPTPLENIRRVFKRICPAGFVVGCSAIITAEFTNRRVFEADEVPTEVVISFHAVTLPGNIYNSCSYGDAVKELIERGILTAQG